MKWNKKPSLKSVFDKIERAGVHRDQFIRRDVNWMRHHTYRIVGEIHGEGRVHLYRVAYAPPTDPWWALTAGDCIHNLRCALDHLACQLVIASGRLPGIATQFPIWPRPIRYRRDSITGTVSPEPIQVRPNVSAPILEAIESVQPYSDTVLGDTLSLINDLDVIDKHRKLVLVDQLPGPIPQPKKPHEPPLFFNEAALFDTLDRLGIEITHDISVVFAHIPPPELVFFGIVLPGSLKDGKVAVKITYDEPRLELDPNLYFLPRPCFGKGMPREGQQVSLVLNDLVFGIKNELIPRFARFF